MCFCFGPKKYFVCMPVSILAVIPVELHPLVPEGEGVHLQSMLLDLLDEVGRPALIAPPPNVISTPGGHKVSLEVDVMISSHTVHPAHLIYPHPRQANVVEPLPHCGVAGDVPLEEEHQLEVRLVLHVLQAAHLKCL